MLGSKDGDWRQRQDRARWSGRSRRPRRSCRPGRRTAAFWAAAFERGARPRRPAGPGRRTAAGAGRRRTASRRPDRMLVLRPLEPGGAVDEGVEAGGRRVQRALGVHAQVLELVVGLHRLRHRRLPTRIGPRSRRTPRAAPAGCRARSRSSLGEDELQEVTLTSRARSSSGEDDADAADAGRHRADLGVAASWGPGPSTAPAMRRDVGDAQQQRDDDPVGDQRRAAVGQERGREAGQRDQPGDAADDDEDLQREHDRQAAASSWPNGVAAR